MNTFKKYFFLSVFSLGLLFTGCVDNDFDEPENTFKISNDDVVTIEYVLDLLEGESTLLTDELVGGSEKYLYGTIVADDASGNLFKIVVFEDETGGLSIIPDRNELNAEFPVGKKVYVKLNGLTIANNNGLPQLGYSIDEDGLLQRIPDLLVNEFLFASEEEGVVVPTIVSLEEINENPNQFFNRLVTIQDVEFRSDFIGDTYAITNTDNESQPESINAILQNCNAQTIIARNSGYSEFAGDLMPVGNGNLTGVVGKFGEDLQIFIRDLNDVDFMNPRCLEKFDGMNFVDISVLANKANSSFQEIDEDMFGFTPTLIRGKVISSDEEGNFYRTIVIEDQTGGIRLSTDADGLYKDYPIGSEVVVSVTGLTLLSDANTPTLGYGRDPEDSDRLERIPIAVTYGILNKVASTFELSPSVVTISTLNSNTTNYINRLVTLNNVEASLSFVGGTYGDIDDIDGPMSRNMIIQDCSDRSIILRNSGFADFASEIVPSGNGTLTAVFSVFLDDKQLFIRSLEDVNFENDRCDGSGGQAENEITIESIQERYYNLGADKAEEGYITGVVISDKDAGQVNELNIIVQNGDAGIVVRFSSDHDFNLGDELQITVTGQEVSEFNSVLQVSGVPVFNAIKKGTAELPAPKELTVSEILQDNNTYESTRVLIKEATLDGPSTFGGTVVVDDGTGMIDIFTWNDAAYANDPVPSGTVNVTGIVGEYQGTTQLVLNSSSDVSGGTIDPGGDDDVSTGFENYEDGDAINKDGWETIATKGTRTWVSTSFDGDRFAECEAYQDDNPETEAWMITPTIDTDEKFRFSFQSAMAYWEHSGLTVWVSQDFTDLGDANWVLINDVTLPTDTDEYFELIDSGEIDLRDYLGGKVRVGFKYEGTAAQNTTKIRIDNVSLK